MLSRKRTQPVTTSFFDELEKEVPKKTEEPKKIVTTTKSPEIKGKPAGQFGKSKTIARWWISDVRNPSDFKGFELMEEAKKDCPKDSSPVVIVNVAGKDRNDSLVIMRNEDWMAWFRELYSDMRLANERKRK